MRTRTIPAIVGFALATTVALPRMTAAVPDSDIRNIELANYKTHFKMAEYRTRKQWETRRQELQRQLLSAAGLLPMPEKTPLRPQVVRHLEYRDYAIEVVLLETLPGYFLGGNLYRPVGKKLPAPALLIPHGHWKRGRLEDQPSYSVPALGINLAKQGYIAFAYDMVGFNDTRQTPHSFGGWSEALWAFNPMGLQLWNSIRAVDYLQSLADVDCHRLGATGSSGGASQTFLLAAVDERIGFAAPVNMVSAYMQGGDPCEEAPNLRVDTFNVEIAAMMAPRPMLLVSSTHDWTRHTPEEEFPAIQRIYGLYGSPQNVWNRHFDMKHNYNRQTRQAVYRFLAQYIQPAWPPAEPVDEDVSLPSEEDLLAFPKAGSHNLEGYTDVFRTWKVAGLLRTQSHLDANEQREALRSAVGAKWPSQVESEIRGNRIVLSRSGKGDRVTGYWTPGKGTPILIVHPTDSGAAARTEEGARSLRSGRPVLMIDAFRESETRIRWSRSDAYFLSYNRSVSSERVQDILTAAAYLKSQLGGRLELIGLGDAGAWCVFAAAIAPTSIDVVADLNGFGGSDEDFRDRFFVPGIQRAGGLSAALKLLQRDPHTVVRVRMPLPGPGTERAQATAGQ
jgi:dienelactone hydrolase